jgi:hypothetical protein
MIVIGHEAVGVADPVTASEMLEGVQEVLTVRVLVEDGLLIVPAGSHMIDSAWILYAKRA